MLRHRLLLLAASSVAIVVAAVPPLNGNAARPSAGPVVGANNLVDQDHNLNFSSNKQNETSITRDPQTGVLVAGANDEIQEGPCPGTTTPLASPCPFVRGVGVSGFYRSTDNGASWTGGILPGTPGRSSGGDPSLDYGPSRCQDGEFRFSCGTVVYYASLEDPVDPDLHLSEAMGVARSFDDGATWQAPVEVTAVSKSNFDDHEWIAVDNKQPSSPFFGRVYVFWAVFCASCTGNGNVKLFVAHSSDEGATWSAPVQVSQGGTNNSGQGFRETGQMAVSSNGTVEAFWSEDEDSTHRATLQVAAVSNDGGASFSGPFTMASVTDYPLTGTPFDVVDLFNRVPGMSARVDCFPHPGAAQSGGAVYAVWCDFAGGHGVVKAAVSLDGANWRQLGTIADLAGRNAFFPAVSVDPAGTVDLTFDALTAPPAGNPFQTGVQVYDNFFAQSTDGGLTFTAPLRVSSMSSNPDGSSYNNLKEQFIGDYIGIVSGPGQAFIVWTDSRNAAACSAVDAYRNQVYAGSKTAVAPNPDSACDSSFGNTDTYEATVNY